MALQFPHTNILFDSISAPLTGDSTGPWFAFQVTDGRTHQVIQTALSAGSVTSIKVQGRIDANSPVVDLIGPLTASDTSVVARMQQIRVAVVGGVAAAIRVTVDKPGRQVS